MSKHTPGPWQLSIETPTIIKQDLSSIGLSRGGVLIGSACWHESSGLYPTREQAIANALLIAAAPEMLQMLIYCRDWLQGSEPHRARAVSECITKATGEQP